MQWIGIGLVALIGITILGSAAIGETIARAAPPPAVEGGFDLGGSLEMTYSAIAIRNAMLAPVWDDTTFVPSGLAPARRPAPQPQPDTLLASIFGASSLAASEHIGNPVSSEVSTALLVVVGLLGLMHLSGARARS
jgi:hypothetical protein